jgi:hypothetical protein
MLYRWRINTIKHRKGDVEELDDNSPSTIQRVQMGHLCPVEEKTPVEAPNTAPVSPREETPVATTQTAGAENQKGHKETVKQKIKKGIKK